mmetsp:Transcript_18533/g.34332  ORF Transcript_18533/g.34332 Transcript_18533/m.34332 type:complete len:153 (+) Transcript_18533:85-543(+)
MCATTARGRTELKPPEPFVEVASANRLSFETSDSRIHTTKPVVLGYFTQWLEMTKEKLRTIVNMSLKRKHFDRFIWLGKSMARGRQWGLLKMTPFKADCCVVDKYCHVVGNFVLWSRDSVLNNRQATLLPGEVLPRLKVRTVRGCFGPFQDT